MEPSARELSGAREEFRHLLDVQTRELDWQTFFSEHPYVLSMSLPLSIEPADIVPLGRPGRTEPDFIFYPRHTIPVPYYGVIELKKPSSQILTTTRKNVAILSRDAETAVQQAICYSDGIAEYAPILAEAPTVFLGNRAHMFVVMGMSQEISERLAADVYREMITKRLPPNLQVLPFDTLLARFESKLPSEIYILMPQTTIPLPQTILTWTKLYVGNMSYSVKENELRDAFERAGTVLAASVLTDRMTGRSKGFGFVEMASHKEAQAAVEMWNGRNLGDRTLTVLEARPMDPRPPRTGTFKGGIDRGGRAW